MTNTSKSAAKSAPTAEFMRAGHGKHTACSHPCTKPARDVCRAARRARYVAAQPVAAPIVERTLTVMFGKSSTVHLIMAADDAVSNPVTACNKRSIKSVEFDEVALDTIVSCKNCAKLDVTTTGSY